MPFYTFPAAPRVLGSRHGQDAERHEQPHSLPDPHPRRSATAFVVGAARRRVRTDGVGDGAGVGVGDGVGAGGAGAGLPPPADAL